MDFRNEPGVAAMTQLPRFRSYTGSCDLPLRLDMPLSHSGRSSQHTYMAPEKDFST